MQETTTCADPRTKYVAIIPTGRGVRQPLMVGQIFNESDDNCDSRLLPQDWKLTIGWFSPCSLGATQFSAGQVGKPAYHTWRPIPGSSGLCPAPGRALAGVLPSTNRMPPPH